MPKQFHTLRKFSHCVVAMGCESASSEVAAVPVYGGLAPVLTEGSTS
jgi:hypothetical protein